MRAVRPVGMTGFSLRPDRATALVVVLYERVRGAVKAINETGTLLGVVCGIGQLRNAIVGQNSGAHGGFSFGF